MPDSKIRITVTHYLERISSWCFWAAPVWSELKSATRDRVDFEWKIALMDASGFPKSRAQAEWFYRRSGMMMRSPFMLSRAGFNRTCRNAWRRIWSRKPRGILALPMIGSGWRW